VRFLDKISDKAWEAAGAVFGLSACSLIAVQLYQEWSTDGPSSLSWPYLIGFTFVYLFWFLYGLRFKHIGVWLPNAFTTILQLLLCVCVAIKSIA